MGPSVRTCPRLQYLHFFIVQGVFGCLFFGPSNLGLVGVPFKLVHALKTEVILKASAIHLDLENLEEHVVVVVVVVDKKEDKNVVVVVFPFFSVSHSCFHLRSGFDTRENGPRQVCCMNGLASLIGNHF